MAELFRFVNYYHLHRCMFIMVHDLLVRAKRRVAGWVGNGVAGMMKLIVSQWIIAENSLRKTHQEVFRSFWECQMLKPDSNLPQEIAAFQTLDSKLCTLW